MITLEFTDHFSNVVNVSLFPEVSYDFVRLSDIEIGSLYLPFEESSMRTHPRKVHLLI